MTQADRPRILLVDDEPAVLVAYRRLLARSGAEADTAGSLAEAVDLLGRQHFAAVVVEHRLGNPPVEEGLRLAELMRSSHPEVPCLLLTGSSRLPDPCADGSTTFLCLEKPVWPRDLFAALRRLGVGV